mmetsp:Transcript_30887/g.81842  ORF Transcript_30887/g.81842 Transcript_30887/m.81842 type:complete len:227 (-) Transcript_30887:102-782(-)
MMLRPLRVHITISSASMAWPSSLSISLKIFSVARLSSIGWRDAAFSGIMAFTNGFRYSSSSAFDSFLLPSVSRTSKTACTQASVVPLKNTEQPPAHSPVLRVPLTSKSMESKMEARSSLFTGRWFSLRSSAQTSTNCSLLMETPCWQVSIWRTLLPTFCLMKARPSVTSIFLRGERAASEACLSRLPLTRLFAFQDSIPCTFMIAFAVFSNFTWWSQPHKVAASWQ